MLWQSEIVLKKQRHHLANNGPYSQSYDFSSSHVQMRELDHKEGWTLKNWCFQIVLLKKTLESLLDFKEIKPVNSKENQSWILIGRIEAGLKLQYFGLLMQRVNSLEKTLMLGKIEGRRRRGWQRVRWLDSITNSTDMNLSKLWEMWRTGKHGILQSMGSQRVGHNLMTKQQRYLDWKIFCCCSFQQIELTMSLHYLPAPFC